MFQFVENIKFRIKLLLIVIVLIILVLVGVVLFFKISEFKSYGSSQSQANSTVSMSHDIGNISGSLYQISQSINNLAYETCMTRADGDPKIVAECDMNKLDILEPAPLPVEEEASLFGSLKKAAELVPTELPDSVSNPFAEKEE